MAATTTQPDTRRILRFTKTERVAHWVNAGLFAVVMLTGAVLKDIGGLSGTVGNRELVRFLHVYCGLAIPVAFVAAYAPRWGKALRLDVSRINRWSPGDLRWLRTFGRDRSVKLDKFNPGQKLNAAFVAAAAIVMVATGLIMAAGSIFPWLGTFPDNTKTGATFVHDAFALFIWMAVLGHIYLAFNDSDALRSMTRGDISTRWARAKRPLWYDEQVGSNPQSEGTEAG
jgi:formate dehydrogenase subunit gamma